MRCLLFGLTTLLCTLAPVSVLYVTADAGTLSCDINGVLNPAACVATLSLPTVDVVTPLTHFPVADGTWQISPWEPLVGHFQYTDWFGMGNTVVGGHATLPDLTPGVFHALHELRPGDPIKVERPGSTAIYIVQRVYVTHYRDLSPVYTSHQRRLTLITCDPPSFDPATGRHEDRVIVQAVRLR